MKEKFMKLEAKDLRIGNLVTDEYYANFKTINEVCDINKKGIDLFIDDDGNYPECADTWIEANFKIEDIRGIPITEDWFAKLHETVIVDAKNKYCEIGRFKLIWKDAYKYWYVVDLETGIYMTKIEFVHEWQNFWSVMNGEELKIIQ